MSIPIGRRKIIILRILNIESSDCYFYLYKALLCRTFKIDDEADTRPKSEAGVGEGTAGRLLKNTKIKKPLNCIFMSCHIQSKTSADSLHSSFLPFSLTFALVKVTSDLQVANANWQFSGPVLRVLPAAFDALDFSLFVSTHLSLRFQDTFPIIQLLHLSRLPRTLFLILSSFLTTHNSFSLVAFIQPLFFKQVSNSCFQT